VAATPGLRIIERKMLGWNGIVINIGNRNGLGNLPYDNVGTPLASSPLLRKAFEEAIDRTALVRVVFGGLGEPSCTWNGPTSPWFDRSIRCTPYDPADAKKLVAASGVPNPTVHMLVAGVGSGTLIAQFIQAQEAEVGINVVLDTVSPAVQQSRRTSGDFDVIISAWTGSPDSDRSIFPFLSTSGDRNLGGYSNPRLDLILANTRKATSPTALRALYHAAAQIVLADRPIIYLCSSTRVAGVSTSVTGVQVGPDTFVRVPFAQLK
jgi:peptide/nickel transport system substrate-binding protein